MSRDKFEDLLLMQMELETRREGDPLRTFPLHRKQRAFVSSVLDRKKKENWFIAANRAGKSDAGAYTGATLARFGRQDARFVGAAGSTLQVRDRSTSGWVSALDFPTSRDVVQPKYFNNGFAKSGARAPFIPDHEIEHWNTEAQVLKLKNGSIIGFKSAESGRRKYQGADKDWFHMDEEHPWEIYEESVIRVGNLPLIFFCTATILPPEGLQTTTSWVFPKIIRPWQAGKLPDVGLFGASIYDNPGIARDEIARLEAIYPVGTPSRRIRLEGEWIPGIGGARAYANFDRTIHISKNPFVVNQRKPLIWMWDFNVEPMVSLVGQVNGFVYEIHREFVLDEGSIAEMCEYFVNSIPEHGGELWIYGDSTGEGRSNQTGKTNYWTIQNEMKQYGSPIRLKVPPENPRVPDRINAMNRILRDEEGTVRLLVDPTCEELITDLEDVKRDNKGGIMKVRNKKDPYFRRTHTSDALGYWIAFEEPVRVESPRGSAPHVPSGLSRGPQYARRG
jgi:phage terminase large subunit-like protein